MFYYVHTQSNSTLATPEAVDFPNCEQVGWSWYQHCVAENQIPRRLVADENEEQFYFHRKYYDPNYAAEMAEMRARIKAFRKDIHR